MSPASNFSTGVSPAGVAINVPAKKQSVIETEPLPSAFSPPIKDTLAATDATEDPPPPPMSSSPPPL